jgi:RimJ/RimL family protein N-acetyltransferase
MSSSGAKTLYFCSYAKALDILTGIGPQRQPATLKPMSLPMMQPPRQHGRVAGRPEVMRFYPAPKSQEEAARWIHWNQQNYVEHGYGLWIVETHDGKFMGDCGLTWQQVNGAQKLEVGYHVRSDLHGQGFATEAATACRDYAREYRSNRTGSYHPSG